MSVMDELEKIALEKGWVKKTADGNVKDVKKDPWDPKSWGIEEEKEEEKEDEDVLKDIEKKVQEQYPTFQLNNDDVFASTAAVVGELVSLANDLDKMGETKMSVAIDKEIKVYKEAMDKLYDVTGETGEQLINDAHGAGPVLFKAQDDGGKVENIVEEQKKSIEKATKNPTGKYAEVIAKLVATANKLEDEGDVEAAKVVDKTILKLKEAAETPPKKYRETGATSKSDYADSENYKYPIHTEKNVRAALSYFSKPKNYGKYSTQERGKIWSRIKSAAGKYKIELDKDNDPPWKAKKAELRGTVPFVNRGSASEMAGSDDDKISSIKKEAAGFNLLFNRKFNNIIHKLIKSREFIDTQLFKDKTKSRTLENWYNDTEKALNNLADSVASGKYSPAQVFNKFKDKIYIPLRYLKKILTDDIIKDAMGMLDYGKYHKPIEQLIFQTYKELEGYKSVKKEPKGKTTKKEELPETLDVKTPRAERYMGTLKKILKSIRDNQPELKQFLGGNFKTVQTLYNNLMKETKKINSYSADEIYKKHKIAWDLLQALKGKGINIKSFNDSLSLLKLAKEEDMDDASASMIDTLRLLGGKPTKTKGKPGKGYRKPEGDPEVGKLQAALKVMGFPLVVDKYWGPRTAAAYNKFLEKYIKTSTKLQKYYYILF
jgi:hypothetical protein